MKDRSTPMKNKINTTLHRIMTEPSENDLSTSTQIPLKNLNLNTSNILKQGSQQNTVKLTHSLKINIFSNNYNLPSLTISSSLTILLRSQNQISLPSLPLSQRTMKKLFLQTTITYRFRELDKLTKRKKRSLEPNFGVN